MGTHKKPSNSPSRNTLADAMLICSGTALLLALCLAPLTGRGQEPVVEEESAKTATSEGELSQAIGQRYRLPTESEWEYAARSGGKNEVWAGTSDEEQLADYAVFRVNSPEPVGRKKENGGGLYDMSGNVWEWVEDCWHHHNEGAPTDGSARLEAGGGFCEQRVIRGGAWDNRPEYLRSSNRDSYEGVSRKDIIGFRLAQDIP